MHGEDIDLFLRAQEAGKKLVRCDCEIIHHRGVSRSFCIDKSNKPFFENYRKYCIKHGLKPGEPNLPFLSVSPDITLQEVYDE